MQDGLAALRPACHVKFNSLSCELHWLFVRPKKREVDRRINANRKPEMRV